MRKWLTFTDVAEELGIPVKSLYLYHYRGDGPLVHRYGRHLRILESDLLKWHEENVIKK